MSRSIMKQLKAVGELLSLDCGDNGCLFAEKKGGMRTNGGCRCDLVEAIHALKAENAEIKRLGRSGYTITLSRKNNALVATLARVRELPVKWRKALAPADWRLAPFQDDWRCGKEQGLEMCADALEDALNGKVEAP